MHKLEQITDGIRKVFKARKSAPDYALAQARQLTRACSLAISQLSAKLNSGQLKDQERNG